jgi:DNA-binding LytR/AlgR family response regulator
MLIRFFALLLIATAFLATPVFASTVPWATIDTQDVRVCADTLGNGAMPDFADNDCWSTGLYKVNPQAAAVWFELNAQLSSTQGPAGQPLAIFISGAFASEVYLNGQFVGRNGQPGSDAGSEVAGLMDSVMYPPQSLFQQGPNKIVVRASSFNGLIQLRNPIHWITIGVSAKPINLILKHYLPTLPVLGLFILGIVYFGLLSIIGLDRKASFILCMACCFVAGQLASEVLRGLSSYPYPIHIIRLILITLFSAGFGLSITFYTFYSFGVKHIFKFMLGVSTVTAGGVVIAVGFDTKALVALLVPLSISALATAVWSWQKRPRAIVQLLTMLTFIGAIIGFTTAFLDVLFYYIVAGFLLLLFIEQSTVFVRESARRKELQRKTERLELALEQAKEDETPGTIKTRGAGEWTVVKINQIVHCSSDSGYTEIVTVDGERVLHSETLMQLQELLPATFIKVHRSHIVNTKYVKSLEREASGTGMLTMEGGARVPISRRIMPRVRQALISAPD